MTNPLVDQVRRELEPVARDLPDCPLDIDAVLAQGSRRRNRSRVVAVGLSGLVVVMAVAAWSTVSALLSSPEAVLVESADGSSEATPTTVTSSTVPSTSARTAADGGLATADVVADLDPDSILFFSDHEGCSEMSNRRLHRDWAEGQQPGPGDNDSYGFAYNSGRLGSEIDWEFTNEGPALSGECSAALDLLDVNGASANAVRLFRRYDRAGSALPADAYYSAWFLVPEDVVIGDDTGADGELNYGFWTIMQLKNMVEESSGGEAVSRSAFSLTAGRSTDDSAMSLWVHNKVPCGLAEDCGQSATIAPAVDIVFPSGRWVHVEVLLKARPDDSGQLSIWQDGVLILDYRGQTERPQTVRRTWNIASSGRLHLSGPHTLYVDDALISTEPVHPRLFAD